MKMDKYLLTAKYHEAMESQKWVVEIPFIKFPSDWEIKVIPPFAGAVVRFQVKVPQARSPVSVYLDCYDRLGFFGAPYWEVYPHRGDIARCPMNDVKSLLEFIADRSEPETND